MLVREEQSDLDAASKVINEEFQKARWCLHPDTNNNDTNNNKILTGDNLPIERSSIKSFYRNACILVTGGTGKKHKNHLCKEKLQYILCSFKVLWAKFCWKNC